MVTQEHLASTVDQLLNRCRAARHRALTPNDARTLEHAAKRLTRLHEDLVDWEPLFGSPLNIIEVQLAKVSGIVEPLLEAAESVVGVQVILSPSRNDAPVTCQAHKRSSGWQVTTGDSPATVVLDQVELGRLTGPKGTVATNDLELWRESIAGASALRSVALSLYVDPPPPEADR